MNQPAAPAAPGRKDRLFAVVNARLQALLGRPALVLAVAALLTAAGAWGTSRLRVDTDLAKLLPPDYPSVVALERLRRTVGADAIAAVIVQSPDPAANRAFAEALIPRLEALRQRGGEPMLTDIEYRRDVAFLEKNALYLATDAEFDTLEQFLRDRIEQARLEANPMLLDLTAEEGDAEGGAVAETKRKAEEIRRDLIPKEYPVSDDGRVLVLRVHVGGSKADLAYVDSVYAALGGAVAALDPKRFHPAMQVDLGGHLLRHSMEMHAIGRDIFSSVGTGMLGVLAVVAAFFFWKGCRVRRGTAPLARIVLGELARTPVAVLVIGLPLAMSIAWTFGLTYLRFGALNLMTSTLALVLFGMGIDFGIHVYARYAEERGAGLAVDPAMRRTLAASVEPVAVTASTTAASFGLLTLADFRGFSEFGFISAVGIVLALLAMLVVLPALIVLCERVGLLRLDALAPAPASAAAAVARRVPFARTTVALTLAGIVAAALLVPRVRFEWNLDRLEPEFPAYDRVRDLYLEVFPPGKRNPAYLIADTPEQVPAIAAAIRARAAADPTPTIDQVETLQERFPLDPAGQRAKLARIAAIRRLLDDKYLRGADSEELRMLRTASLVDAPVPLAALPRGLTANFTSKDGTIGNFIMVYPGVRLSDGRQSMAFSADAAAVRTPDGSVHYAGSTAIVAADMLRLMLGEAPWMVGLTVGSLLILVPLAFRRIGLSLLALAPLGVGILWMLGIAAHWNLGFNFYNLVVLPTVLGMGEDAGVHVTHRWLEEGPGSVARVVHTTGEAVVMCAVTTMLGFTGMIGSFHPGLRSMGWLAVIGMGATLIASVVALPALLQVLDDYRARGAASASR